MSIQSMLSFSMHEYDTRVASVRRSMAERGLDALLVHHFPNICYLTGYQSFNNYDYYALLLPLEGEPALILWDSELGNAKVSSWITRTYTFPTRGDAVALTFTMLNDYKLGKGRIGLELTTGNLTVRSYQRIAAAFPEATFVDCSNLVEEHRLLKSPAEIEYIRQAAALSDSGTEAAVNAARAGGTDQDIAAAAYQTLLATGSEYMCLQPVVCTGMLAGIPHGNHRRLEVKTGDTILLELSGCIHRYNAPLMRAISIGQPDKTARRMADAILQTLNGVIDAMQPGRAFDEVAAIGERAIARAGDDMIFHHTFAYSVGLGFPPTWADCPVTIIAGDQTILKPGLVFHLPISLRKSGTHGVAMSETVVITETGNEVVTELDRVLFER